MKNLWMLAASFLFACMGVCVKWASADFSTPELVFYRSILSLALIASYARWRGWHLATPHWRTHLKRSLSGLLALMGYFHAIRLLSLATAVTLNYTSPLFLALIMAFWLREPVRPAFYGTLIAGFVGIVLLLQPTLASDQWWGAIVGLGSGIAASSAYVNIRRLGAVGEPEWRTVLYFALVGTVGGLLWMAMSRTVHVPALRHLPLLLGIGAFALLAQLCMTIAYTQGKTLAAASLSYSTVVFSSLFGGWLWGEQLPWPAWVGIALILASGLAATAWSRAAPAEQD